MAIQRDVEFRVGCRGKKRFFRNEVGPGATVRIVSEHGRDLDIEEDTHDIGKLPANSTDRTITAPDRNEQVYRVYDGNIASKEFYIAVRAGSNEDLAFVADEDQTGGPRPVVRVAKILSGESIESACVEVTNDSTCFDFSITIKTGGEKSKVELIVTRGSSATFRAPIYPGSPIILSSTIVETYPDCVGIGQPGGTEEAEIIIIETPPPSPQDKSPTRMPGAGSQ